MAVLSAHWCLEVEFSCCSDRAKVYVEEELEPQLQHRPARGLLLTYIRMVVAVELDVMMVAVDVDVLDVLDAVMG